MTVPYWVQDSIFYQIFPDRFANGDSRTDPANLVPWAAKPTVRGFQGGDLRGIIQNLDYLLDLGINAIYLNPIFLSTSTHRYNTTDYFQIDPKLGDLEDFKALIEVAHRNDIHIILDGVFNHCGRGFFAFNDILENQEQSPYLDWFHINHFPVEAYLPGDATDFTGWWKLKSLPKFNTQTKQVRDYLLGVARYWIELGADGWRLDVPNEINDDGFWAEFRETVLSINRDAYLVGEIWEADPRWANHTHFDGLMNYPVRENLIKFINGNLTASQFADQVERIIKLYPRENAYAMYNILGTHDTERIWNLLNGDLKKVQTALMFQFAYPGVPSIYYGDEIGLPGGNDPDNRRTFPWEQENWNVELRSFVQKLVLLRKRIPALRRGNFKRLIANDARGCLAFSRSLGDETVVMALNTSQTRRSLRLPVSSLGWQDGLIVHDLMGDGEYIVSGDTLHIQVPPTSGFWLK